MMKTQKSFIAFLEERIQYLKESNRYGTASNYRRAKSSLLRFLDGKDLSFKELNEGFVDSYNDWLTKMGNVRNSTSFHMRILRATFNKGVKQGFAKQTFPFRDVYTGIDRTRKRYVSKEILSSLISLRLEEFSALDMARDLYLFSIYGRGISFIDIAFLTSASIENDYLVYRRKKTKQILKIKIEKPIREIIDKYRCRFPDSPYLFPILKKSEPEETYRLYLCALTQYNTSLKQLSAMIGLNRPLTSYTARHTWASLAKNMEIPVSVISECMGHTSEQTTRIYLASLDNETINKANSRVLSLLACL